MGSTVCSLVMHGHTASNDEWVFSDVDSIQEIIIPAARIALKVHQVCLSVCSQVNLTS